MKRLDDHNKEVRNKAKGNVTMSGVACPKCPGLTEMHFMFPGLQNLSSPPSETVVCPKCNHIGYKYE